jgi:hypothetical protein
VREADTIHRHTECVVRYLIWDWSLSRITRIQRMDKRRIPKEWLLRPCSKLSPQQRHQATLWFLVSMAFFVVNQRRTLSVWTTLTLCIGRGERYVRTKKDAARGKLSGGVLRRPGILEHSTNETNSKHYKSSLVHITRAYKISALTLLFF